MKFEKPDIAALQSERDVEDKVLYPLLISEPPTGLGSDPSQVRAQKNLRKFTIGKGRDQKSYVPDYVILRGNIPLVVVEAKKPVEDVMEAFREARLYAAELNSIHPSGLNPTTRVIASNGLRLVAGLHDQSQPVLDLTLEEIDPYSIGMAKLIELCGGRALDALYSVILPRLKPRRHWKPIKLVGGLAKQKEQVPVNSFGSTITTDFGHLFNPQTKEERSYIAKYAYISSKRRERYIEPIDRVIRAALPPSVTSSKMIEDTESPREVIKPFRDLRALEQKVMLLIGSAGAGKSTFVDYLQEKALPADIRKKTLWIRIDMNPAPVSREEIYNWLRSEIIRGCREANPEADFDELETLKAVHATEVNQFRKGVGRLYQATPGLFDTKLADKLAELNGDKHVFATNITRYCSAEKGRLLVIVLDNSDKRLREEQLLMFEAAQWLQREFRGLVVLPLREETYDNHRNEPPLDTALKDLVFRIEPPLFQKILLSRINLALRELTRSGQRTLSYNLSNGVRVEYPASDQGYYLSSILRSIFEHDLHVRRLIVGLSGRNMRRALEIFLEFCTSGHIGAEEITKIRLSEGQHVLPRSLVTNVLLRVNQRYYESDASYLKNLFGADEHDRRPHFFARLIILKLLDKIWRSPQSGSFKGYLRVETLRHDVARFGVEESQFRRELEYLVRAFCIVCEDFRQQNITDSDLVSIAPAGHVHLEIYDEQYYLAAVSEDSWFDDESVARQIAVRITDPRKHYSPSVTLENADDLLEQLEARRMKEVAAYEAVHSDSDLAILTDLSGAKSNIRRFELANTQPAWVGANRKFPVGSIHVGTIVNSESFGLFVDLSGGLTGLIHSSKLPPDFPSRTELALKNTVKVKILSVDRIDRRLELQLMPNS